MKALSAKMPLKGTYALLILLLVAVENVTGFSPLQPSPVRSSGVLQQVRVVVQRNLSLNAQAPTVSKELEDSQQTTAKGLWKRDRYIATNRFAVRKGQAAKFEKRWATRKSRLATLDGFKYFHLMRRVQFDGKTTQYDEGDSDEAAQENYVSFTIWNKKSDFSAWRNGEAFKEAHGGTSIGAFVSTMINSALVLRGPPRPAFYDGLFVESTKPTNIPQTVDGWRAVDADGVNTLPAECFVTMEKFFVPVANAAAFEKVWSEISSVSKTTTKQVEGLVASSLMRRDGQAKGHGTVEMTSTEPTYVSTLVFQDEESFLNWNAMKEERSAQRESSGMTQTWTRAPETVFYQGTLVISSPEGA